jgi:hypothetical protein
MVTRLQHWIGFVAILTYQMLKKPVIKEKGVEIVESPSVLPYWTAYSPGYDYWPRIYDSYWLNYVPFYGPITGSSWGYGGYGGYPKHHWDGGRPHYGGHTGVAVGGGSMGSGGGGHGGHGGGGSGGHGGGGGHGGH